MNKESWLFVGLWLVTTAVLIVGQYLTLRQTEQNCTPCQTCQDIAEGSERYAMYNKTINTKVRLNGVYFGGDKEYYCIWMKGKSPIDINYTEEHELCHWLIDKDYKHFCE